MLAVGMQNWLEGIGFGDYQELFAANGIDLDIIGDLNESDFKSLGFNLGDCKRLTRAISDMEVLESSRRSQPVVSPTVPSAMRVVEIPSLPVNDTDLPTVDVELDLMEEPEPEEEVEEEEDALEAVGDFPDLASALIDERPDEAPQPGECAIAGPVNAPVKEVEEEKEPAEQKLLSVLFCDLVGGNALIHCIETAKRRAAVRAYRDAVSSAVTDFDGYVREVGKSGLMIYFGLSGDTENTASQAAMAGLAAVRTVRSLDVPGLRTPSLYLGVATGDVEITGPSTDLLPAREGTVPNLAARLQQIAKPDQLIVCKDTCKQLDEGFETTEMEPRLIKGYEDPVAVFSVQEVLSTAAAPIYGREDELDQLRKLWTKTVEGKGQILMIQGDAGIGKSHLIEAFCSEMDETAYRRIEWRGEEIQLNHPLQPVIEQIRDTADIGPKDDREDAAVKLDRMLEDIGVAVGPDRSLIAMLLSLPAPNGQADLSLSPEQIRYDTLSALRNFLLCLARQRPMVLSVRDAQWLDATSLQLMHDLVEDIRNEPVFLTIGTRDASLLRLAGDHVANLTLSGLSKEHNADLLRTFVSGDITDKAVETIVERAEGMPLMIKAFGLGLNKGKVAKNFETAVRTQVEQFDPELREITEIAAVFGLTFDRGLPAAVLNRPMEELVPAFERLVETRLVQISDGDTAPRFTFEHDLVRRAIIDALPVKRRRQLHREVAHTLETRFPAIAAEQPEVLAEQFENANVTDKAIAYRRRAAARAAWQCADREALQSFHAACSLLNTLPQSVERDRAEYELLTDDGMPALIADNYPMDECETFYLRARELSEKLGTTAGMFPILHDLWLCEAGRGRFEAALSSAEALVEQTKPEGDQERLALAYRSLGTTYLQLGRNDEAWEALSHGIDAMQQHGQPADLATYGEDNGLACRQYFAWAQLFRGLPEKAIDTVQETLKTASEMADPASQMSSKAVACTIHLLRQEVDDVLRLSEEILAEEQENGTNYWTVQMLRNKAWALGRQGKSKDSLDCLAQIDALWPADEQPAPNPIQLGCKAELLGHAGKWKQSLNTIDDALAALKNNQVRWYEAELLRIKGWLLEASGNADQAMGHYADAVKLARKQKNQWWLLRAATAHAGLLAKSKDVVAARQLLSPIFQTFTEGLETKDLRDAKALLYKLL